MQMPGAERLGMVPKRYRLGKIEQLPQAPTQPGGSRRQGVAERVEISTRVPEGRPQVGARQCGRSRGNMFQVRAASSWSAPASSCPGSALWTETVSTTSPQARTPMISRITKV